MFYPVLITTHENQYKISVPDLPGCEDKSPDIDNALIQLKDTIANHLSILAEYGEAIPKGKTVKHWQAIHPVGIWALVEIDITPYLGKSHKINVTLPELLIKQIDDKVSKSEKYKTRSGFIATACLNELTLKD